MISPYVKQSFIQAQKRDTGPTIWAARRDKQNKNQQKEIYNLKVTETIILSQRREHYTCQCPFPGFPGKFSSVGVAYTITSS